MKVLYKVALRHHLGVPSKKGAVFFPRCLSGVPTTPGYTGLGFLSVLCSRTRTGPVGVTSPETNSKLVAKLGNKPLD